MASSLVLLRGVFCMLSSGLVAAHGSLRRRLVYSRLRILMVPLACTAFAVHRPMTAVAQSPEASSDRGRGAADDGPGGGRVSSPSDPHPGKLDTMLRREVLHGGPGRIRVIVTKERGQSLDNA